MMHRRSSAADENIAADFLLTNELMQVEQRLASQKPVLEKLTGRPGPEDCNSRH